MSQEVRHIDQTNNENPMYNFSLISTTPAHPWVNTLMHIKQWLRHMAEMRVAALRLTYPVRDPKLYSYVNSGHVQHEDQYDKVLSQVVFLSVSYKIKNWLHRRTARCQRF